MFRRYRFILILCALAVAGAVMSPVRAEPPRFSVLAPGIAHAAFKVRPPDAEPFSGHAFRIDLEVTELRLIPAGDPPVRRPVEQIVAPYPVVVASNASFFDTEGRAMGLAVDEGRVMASSNRRIWGALVIDGKKGGHSVAFAKLVGQRKNLIHRLNVALKENDASGTDLVH